MEEIDTRTVDTILVDLRKMVNSVIETEYGDIRNEKTPSSRTMLSGTTRAISLGEHPGQFH